MSGSEFKKNRGKYSNQSTLQKKINKLKKPGKTYTKAQLLALKRKAQNKSIADVKADNVQAMKDRAAKRYADFKAKKKLKINKSDSKKDNKKKKNKKNNESGVYVPNIKFLK